GDPSALVVFGGPSGNNDRFIDDAYAAGAKGSFDVMATHPYQGLSDAEPERADDGNRWWLTHLPTVREVMLKHGDDKPIWFTEFGWSSHTTEPGAPNWRRGVTEAQQADFLARAVRLTQERYEPVTHMFWYTERDRTQGNLHWNNFGLLRTDLSEKPAYATLRQLLAGR
ncbi:MAG: glycosyl hydrolase, partial [Gaiellaceae bacterium]